MRRKLLTLPVAAITLSGASSLIVAACFPEPTEVVQRGKAGNPSSGGASGKSGKGGAGGVVSGGAAGRAGGAGLAAGSAGLGGAAGAAGQGGGAGANASGQSGAAGQAGAAAQGGVAGQGGAAGTSGGAGQSGAAAQSGAGGAGGASGAGGLAGQGGGGAGGGSGAPGCPGTLVACPGPPSGCFDTTADDQNCGACGTVCVGEETCNESVCGCKNNGKLCDEACVQTGSDAQNCGGCGIVCGQAQSCQTGKCACDDPKQTLCSGACVDIATSANNCGSCGNKCELGVACNAGHCVSEWALWKMPGEPGTPFSYQDIGTDVVLDNVTTLRWQKVNDGTKRNWNDAKAYCDGLVLGGADDWRLPTRIELLSIVDPGPRVGQVSLQLAVFPGTPADSFWTATGKAGLPEKAYTVYFGRGDAGTLPRTEAWYVRCVR